MPMHPALSRVLWGERRRQAKAMADVDRRAREAEAEVRARRELRRTHMNNAPAAAGTAPGPTHGGTRE